MNCDNLVCVHCFTYNHAIYINDCLKGFCIQKTSFPVVNIIMDDASTDGTRDVILSYLNTAFLGEVKKKETDDYVMLFAQHKTNINCYFAIYLLKYNHFHVKDKFPYIKEWDDKAKYIASCEGDDYWIAPDKLQKQVDYLETHPDCSAVFSNIIIRDEKVQPIKKLYKNFLKKKIYRLPDVYRGTIFNLNCICVRSIIYCFLATLNPITSNGDFKLSYAAAKFGYVYKFDDYFSVYRSTGKGLSSKWTRKEHFIHSIQEWTDFHRQLGYPDKTSLAIFHAKTINGYLFGSRFKDFPFSDIKNCLILRKWYVYIIWSAFYFICSVFSILRKRLFNKEN